MSGTPTGIGIVGVGKIARDQHIPSIEREPAFVLSAVASRHASVAGVASFATLDAMLDGVPELGAVAVCTPPQARHAIARRALEAGKHVLLEKPPGATLSEVEDLARFAETSGLTLFATWHSRFAPGVEMARAHLARHPPRSVRIDWKEDVEHWHPGQDWIWEAGGVGVFDPGINALSILTRILPRPCFLTRADLFFPSNRDTPIAADLVFRDAAGTPVTAGFDWRQKGTQTWDIAIETEAGSLLLGEGGSRLTIDAKPVPLPPETEYDGIYRRFAELLGSGESDVDVAPLRHVADAFMLGRRVAVHPF